MRKWLKHLKNQKGLTLIELLAVVVILGIIAAIAVPAVGNIIDNSKSDAHKANALLIINSAKLGIVSGDIKPDTDNNISLKVLVDGGVLDTVPADPSKDGQAYSDTASFVKLVGKKYSVTLVSSGSTNVKTYYANITEASLNVGEKPTP